MRRAATLVSALLISGCLQLIVFAPPSEAAITGMWDWGPNSGGQLGNGTKAAVPLPISGPSPSGPIVRVSSGFTETFGIAVDGSLWAWGSNGRGQLGDGTFVSSTVPVEVQVPAGVDVVQVDAGGSHGLALGADGHVWSWGYNQAGQLGDGTLTDRSTPALVEFPRNVTIKSVSAGGLQSMALDMQGRVWEWGGVEGARSHVPVQVTDWPSAQPRIRAISAGGTFNLAMSTVGKVYAWGSNTFGQLGIGSTAASGTPVRVHLPAEAGVTKISAGPVTGYAIGSLDRAWAWGIGSAGQLGNGDTMNEELPVRISVPGGVTFASIAGGPVALAIDGSVWTWGPGGYGTLGDGSFDTPVRTTPGEVQFPAGVQISALASDGLRVFALGTGSPPSDLILNHFGDEATPPDVAVETLGVGNSGTTPSPDVTLTYTLPPDTMFLSADPTQGSCLHAGDHVMCDLGSIDMAASVAVHIRPLVLGTYATSGSVSPTDSTPGDDAFSATYTVSTKGHDWRYVNVDESGFAPESVHARFFGGTEMFAFIGTSPNGVHDASGFGLFDSGTLSPPNVFTYEYGPPGTYPVQDEHGHTMQVGVPVAARPADGFTSTTFRVSWREAPAGQVVDAQVAYCVDPSCAPSFSRWKHATTISSFPFSSADPAWQGAGTYFFRARTRVQGSQTGPDWSPVDTITVT